MHKQKIKPLGNRIVVQRQEVQTSKGGILLPDTAQQKPKRGKVLAVGPGKVDDKGNVQPMDVKIGDEVLFSSYGGTEFKNAAEEVLILSEEDILAVFN
ncbi:MAG TPA: co-chaperone GroES [Chlamydiales bacterium]|jgi:chaperonin GroES|nr:co-chaperone GroES [Chlamydiales bacterium]